MNSQERRAVEEEYNLFAMSCDPVVDSTSSPDCFEELGYMLVVGRLEGATLRHCFPQVIEKPRHVGLCRDSLTYNM